MTVLYKAPVALQEEPVFLTAEIPAGESPLCGFSTADGRYFPAQILPCGTVCTIVTAAEGEELALSPVYGKMSSINCQLEAAESRLTITIGDKAVAGYCWDTALYKPYFGPLTDDDGNMFTRLDFTAKEHPHHRSIFVAVGDVNGVDLWNEPADCGIIRNEKIENVISGNALAS
ncbi:MAG: PmoA family protein, partial [Clostridia bacterium]|nr:PmoA family protein [Clostridia bacterium]